MPIKPENKNRYPKNWKEIREQILGRAENRCEVCGVRNHLVGWRLCNGKFATTDIEALRYEGKRKLITIVLTIAHLDHTPENCDPKNLKAMCQRCHLRYDREHHAHSRALTKARRFQTGAS